MTLSTVYTNGRRAIETRIRDNKYIRAFYRWGFFLPAWVHTVLLWCVLFSAAFPLLLAYTCTRIIASTPFNTLEERRAEVAGCILYLLLVVALTYAHPIGWALVILTAIPLVYVSFSCLMDEYECELEKQAGIRW